MGLQFVGKSRHGRARARRTTVRTTRAVRTIPSRRAVHGLATT